MFVSSTPMPSSRGSSKRRGLLGIAPNEASALVLEDDVLDDGQPLSLLVSSPVATQPGPFPAKHKATLSKCKECDC
jgi:hypothetical protein